MYSVNGFQAPLDFSGEARNPRRNVPAAVLTGIALAVLVYLGLQLAFLYTVPDSLLTHGWQGVNFDSPFGQLALVLNLHWLATLLYADAVVSPGGSAYVGVALDARHTYALAKNGLVPRFFMRIDPRSGIARRALVLNLVVIILFMLPFGGWQDIVSVMGDMYLLIYAASAVAVASFRAHDRERGVPLADGQVPGVRWIAPVSFAVSTEFIYWSGWEHLRLALPLVLAGVPLYLLQQGRTAGRPVREELSQGAWIVFHLAALTLLSWLGTFGGSGRLPASPTTPSWSASWPSRSSYGRCARAQPISERIRQPSECSRGMRASSLAINSAAAPGGSRTWAAGAAPSPRWPSLAPSAAKTSPDQRTRGRFSGGDERRDAAMESTHRWPVCPGQEPWPHQAAGSRLVDVKQLTPAGVMPCGKDNRRVDRRTSGWSP